MFFPTFLVAIDIIWLVAWFAVFLWLEISGIATDFSYRDTLQSMLGHRVTTTLMLVYVLQTRVRIHALTLVLFGFVFSSDLFNLVEVFVHTEQTIMSAWVALVVLSNTALAVTVLAIFWFVGTLLFTKQNYLKV